MISAKNFSFINKSGSTLHGFPLANGDVILKIVVKIPGMGTEKTATRWGELACKDGEAELILLERDLDMVKKLNWEIVKRISRSVFESERSGTDKKLLRLNDKVLVNEHLYGVVSAFGKDLSEKLGGKYVAVKLPSDQTEMINHRAPDRLLYFDIRGACIHIAYNDGHRYEKSIGDPKTYSIPAWVQQVGSAGHNGLAIAGEDSLVPDETSDNRS